MASIRFAGTWIVPVENHVLVKIRLSFTQLFEVDILQDLVPLF